MSSPQHDKQAERSPDGDYRAGRLTNPGRPLSRLVSRDREIRRLAGPAGPLALRLPQPAG